ncbi:NAD(P)-dependent alcohol dehydrogenase [Pontibacter sp. MBLB2868]|uniref:NAD(P)-dependent alcohol dehydrogenase n=1 Tax=Pontibacter sp. MBLB2868 TaxID=3451555 RepID=UPI003F753919
MRAVFYNKYGSVDVLQYGELPKPVLKHDQVLVRVHAASVNPVDWKAREGKMMPVTGLTFPRIPGVDIAGVVAEIGRDVESFLPGDRVFGMISDTVGGAYAEYAAISEKVTVPIPDNLTYKQAAAVPLTALTALQALRDKGELKAGEKVLINGASSGVGIFAIQIAKVLGAAEITGVCSTDHVQLVKSLGADNVIDYTEEDFMQHKQKYDLIFDAVAKTTYLDSKDCLKHHGRYVTTVPDPKDIALGFMLSVFSDKKLKTIITKDRGEDLKLIKHWIEAEQVKPVIDKIFPLKKAAEAQKYSEAGHAAGKIILMIDGE